MAEISSSSVYSLPFAETFSEVPILDLIEITVSGFLLLLDVLQRHQR